MKWREKEEKRRNLKTRTLAFKFTPLISDEDEDEQEDDEDLSLLVKNVRRIRGMNRVSSARQFGWTHPVRPNPTWSGLAQLTRA